MSTFKVTTSSGACYRFEYAKPIHVAAANDDIGALIWLLQGSRGAQIDVEGSLGTTSLFIACFLGYMEHYKMLIEKGASAARAPAEEEHRHPFYGACFGGHTTICRYLYSLDGSVLSTMIRGMTPLEVAAENGHTNLVRFFLRNNCKVSLVAQTKAFQNGHTDLGNLLRQEWMGRSQKSEPGGLEEAELDQLRLESACSGNKEEVLIDLVEKGFDPNTRTKIDRRTLLHEACLKGWVKAVGTLIDRGANMEALDGKNEETPLLAALRKRNSECARSLLKHGASIRAWDARGTTVLHTQTVLQDPKELEFLIAAGADIHARDLEGCTPLLWTRDIDCIHLLLEKGVNPFSESLWGSPFWQWVSNSNFSEIVSKIERTYCQSHSLQSNKV